MAMEITAALEESKEQPEMERRIESEVERSCSRQEYTVAVKISTPCLDLKVRFKGASYLVKKITE